MAAPNIEVSSNPSGTGGNTSGVKLGLVPTQTLGFYGDVGVVQPTVTGARDDGEGALASLLTALADLGLIVNNTTAT